MTRTTLQTPVHLSLSNKVIGGIAALGTSLISGTYGALLPIFYQDYFAFTSKSARQ